VAYVRDSFEVSSCMYVTLESRSFVEIQRMLNEGLEHGKKFKEMQTQAPLTTQKGRIPSGVTIYVTEN